MDYVSQARDFFGTDTVATKDLMTWFKKEHNRGIPADFYKNRRAERGFFSLAEVVQLQAPTVAAKVTAPPTIQGGTSETIINVGEVFDSSKLIPRLDNKFVPYGQYKKVEKIVKSGKFFPILISGPTGVGKSSMVKHICAKNKLKFARVTMTKHSTDEDLFGRMTLKNGETVWEDGILTLAAEQGFTLVIDEITAASADNLFGLYTIMEGERHLIKEANKFVEPNPGFNIILTDNTLGRGDETGTYIGTNIQNEAMLDRIKMTLIQGYPPEIVERKVLVGLAEELGINVTEAFEDMCVRIAKWGTMIRGVHAQGAIDDVISLRRTQCAIEHYAIFGNELEAIEDVCGRFGETTQKTFTDFYKNLVDGVEDLNVLTNESDSEDTDIDF